MTAPSEHRGLGAFDDTTVEPWASIEVADIVLPLKTILAHHLKTDLILDCYILDVQELMRRHRDAGGLDWVHWRAGADTVIVDVRR